MDRTIDIDSSENSNAFQMHKECRLGIRNFSPNIVFPAKMRHWRKNTCTRNPLPVCGWIIQGDMKKSSSSLSNYYRLMVLPRWCFRLHPQIRGFLTFHLARLQDSLNSCPTERIIKLWRILWADCRWMLSTILPQPLTASIWEESLEQKWPPEMEVRNK